MTMSLEVDVLIIGAGPAGAATAILLANAGWQVALVEQHVTPHRKVCGECIPAASLGLLDRLGVGDEFRRIAGPELVEVAWMRGQRTVLAALPRCTEAADHYGRALGREYLDDLLLRRARAAGADVLQPARVRAVRGGPGSYRCELETESRARRGPAPGPTAAPCPEHISARVVVAAHGSWEREPLTGEFGDSPRVRRPPLDSDLLAFKANFRDAALAPGTLAVLAFAGGYGGMVVANHASATLACCIRRDALRASRASVPELAAGLAVEAHLRRVCRGVGVALADATRVGPWLSAGPIRPGIRVWESDSAFRVGNAAGETHPLIGEGISMALQSAVLLTRRLLRVSPRVMDKTIAGHLRADYARDWCDAFATRVRLAAAYSYVAMHAPLAIPTGLALRQWPRLLTEAARWAGKARPAFMPLGVQEGSL